MTGSMVLVLALRADREFGSWSLLVTMRTEFFNVEFLSDMKALFYGF